MSRLQLLGHAMPDAHVVDDMLARVASGESLSRVTGIAFFGDAVLETDGVLCPRADSEVLVVEAVARAKKRARVCDLGTGSGALLIWLLQQRPDVVGVGVDQSSKAIEIATKNLKRNGVRGELFHLDWNSKPIPFDPFDLIMWNPPYVCTRDCSGIADPVSALDGGIDGLDCYRNAPWHFLKSGKIELFDEFCSCLVWFCFWFVFWFVLLLLFSGGIMIVEIGQGMKDRVVENLATSSKLLSIRKDLQGCRCFPHIVFHFFFF